MRTSVPASGPGSPAFRPLLPRLLPPVSFLLLLSGCSPAWRPDLDRLEGDLARVPARLAPDPQADAELDRILAGPVDADVLIEAARIRNPELRESAARTRAALEEVSRAGSLDDPMLKVQPWMTPRNRPADFDDAAMIMYGLMQRFPFPGKLDLASEAALREAERSWQMHRDRERDVVARLKRAFARYFAAAKEIEIHAEHIRILEELEAISDAKFRTGTVSQQDVLKPQVELVLLHNEVLFSRQRLGSAQAEINALLGRPAGAALGPPRDLPRPGDRPDVQELEAAALGGRPELLAAASRVRSSAASLELSERDSAWPDLGVELMYMQAPDGDDGWGGSLSINLPWFTGRRSAETRRQREILRADEAAERAVRDRILLEVRDAFLRVEAARKSLVLIGGELLPKSAQSVEVSRATYEKDRTSFLELLDAERSQRDVKLRYYRTLAEHESAVADLERAVGADLRRTP